LGNNIKDLRVRKELGDLLFTYCVTNLLPHLLHRLSQRWDNHKQITNHAVACLLEHGRVRVFVDCHDDFGVSHSNEVLDRTGDAAGDIAPSYVSPTQVWWEFFNLFLSTVDTTN